MILYDVFYQITLLHVIQDDCIKNVKFFSFISILLIKRDFRYLNI